MPRFRLVQGCSSALGPGMRLKFSSVLVNSHAQVGSNALPCQSHQSVSDALRQSGWPIPDRHTVRTARAVKAARSCALASCNSCGAETKYCIVVLVWRNPRKHKLEEIMGHKTDASSPHAERSSALNCRIQSRIAMYSQQAVIYQALEELREILTKLLCLDVEIG
jgi:hypothetical protein